ncbi:MAG: 16S rRNA (cytidine(1402)-2'-O)-methyltransferase [Oscillospiraceae bacterium]
MGILYVVGTPIGNLGDMTCRAADTLREVDFICAEDTRVSAKLLNYLDIKKPLISYHEHNAQQAGEGIVQRILSGENAAIITDAGMPCISDPGEQLVRLCADSGVKVCVVPGPTAAMSAVAISGLSTKSFTFKGFLPVDKKQRYAQLASVKSCTDTLIFYEAPHKLLSTLEDMLKYFGDRKIAICRELTKIHEEVIRTTISQAVLFYKENKPKGEFVLVVEGAAQAENAASDTLEDALLQVRQLAENGMRPADACREIAKVTRFSKGELYTAFLAENDRTEDRQ